MNLLSLFAFTVYAAGSIISPIPDDYIVAITPPPKPEISFGQIIETPPIPTPEVLAAATIAPTPTIMQTKKKSYTIAYLGDSMIDTMGPGLPAVQTDLQNMYPSTNFTLVNYGVGGTNIEYGIERITQEYTYLGKSIPALTTTHPDIVVLESFSYNPFPNTPGVDRHWLALAKAVDTLRTSIPGVKIVIAATIAPNSAVFGDGAPNIAFSPEDKRARTDIIKQYLDNTVKFAASQHLPLADAYHPSIAANGEGNLAYINNGDHIHYSPAGRAFFAQILVRTLKSVL